MAKGSKFRRSNPPDSESYVRVSWVRRMYERYYKYWKSDIDRYVRNAKALWGLNFGQYPAYVVQRLLDQGRRPFTANILLDKAETFIGSIKSGGYDIRYRATSANMDTLVNRINGMYSTDKKHCNWDAEETIALLDMGAAVGMQRMIVSDQYHALGNIAWENPDPRHTLIDPTWRSNNVNDIKSYATFTRMTPQEIMDTSPSDVSDALLDQMRREMTEGIDYGEPDPFGQYDTPEAKWADKHLVIEYHWVEKDERWWEYDLKNCVPFPETGFKNNSEEDKQAKMEYAQSTGLSPFDITWEKQNKKIKYIQRIAPTINSELFLANGKDRIQTNNCNIYPIGFRYAGQYQGLVDRLYDIQLSLNRGEMDMDDIRLRTARGAKIIDSALAGNDPRRKAEIEEAINDAGAAIWADEGTTADLGPNGGIIQINQTPITADVFRHQERRYEMADRMSKVPAAQESRVENSGEPNRLFENKIKVAQIGQWMYSEVYRQHCIDKAYAYIRQAKVTYAGAPRKFEDENGDPMWINMPGQDQQGRPVTLDDISKLPELTVDAAISQTSETMRLENQTTLGQLLPLVSQDPGNRLIMLSMISGICASAQLSDESKDELDKALQLSKMQAALAIAGSIKQMQGVLQQAEASAQAAIAGPQQQPGAAPQAPQSPQFAQNPGDVEQPRQQITHGRPTPEQTVAGTTLQKEGS
jgi:hypothetical protein